MCENWNFRDECDYRSLTIKGLHIHTGKQKTMAQLDGAEDNHFKENIGALTEDSLIIFLQGEVAEDPDDELIPVGETFWPLPKVFLL